MTRKDKIDNLRHMLYCLQLIVTNDEVSYYFADSIILDDFMVSLCNQLYSKRYEVSNYLENENFPYEFTDSNEKIINQIILSSDNESIYEVFDNFEILLNENSELREYTLYITFLGIDSVKSMSSLSASLKDYSFNYKLFGGEDLVKSLAQVRDEELLNGYEMLIHEQSQLFSVLLHKEDPLLDRLLEVLSAKAIFIASTPTIFPQSIREYYENTATLKMYDYPKEVFENIVRIYNAYSRHALGPRVSIGSVYSYIRQMWVKIGILPDEIPYKAQQALSKAILEDTRNLVSDEEIAHLTALIDAIIIEAFMRLKVDYTLYDF